MLANGNHFGRSNPFLNFLFFFKSLLIASNTFTPLQNRNHIFDYYNTKTEITASTKIFGRIINGPMQFDITFNANNFIFNVCVCAFCDCDCNGEQCFSLFKNATQAITLDIDIKVSEICGFHFASMFPKL